LTNYTTRFNGYDVIPQQNFKDRKYFGLFNYPSGIIEYDVSPRFNKDTTNIATFTRWGIDEGPSLNGMYLIIIFYSENTTRKLIWINDGSDILYYNSLYPWVTKEEATAFARFYSTPDITDKQNLTRARLITIAQSASPTEGQLSFNGHNWTAPWTGGNETTFGISSVDVTPYIIDTENTAQFKTYFNDDYFVPTNAILILEFREDPPTVDTINPNSSCTESTFNTSITGTNFNTSLVKPVVRLTRNGQANITAFNVNATSSTTINCSFSIPQGTVTGLWNVNVTNPDGQTGSGSNLFNITQGPPTVTSITPSSGTSGTTVSITNLAGTNFVSTPSVVLNRTGYANINATGVSVVSSTRIICSFNLASAATGPWNVRVTNPDGQSGTLPSSFTVTPPIPPTVTSITPASGITGTIVTITNLAGTGFNTTGTLVVNLTRTGYSSITATNVVTTSSTSLTCTFNLASVATGLWNVTVTNPDSLYGTLQNGFTVTPPTVTSITPASGTSGTVIDITNLAGTGFSTTGTPVVNLTRTGYANIIATNVAVPSSTQITCRFDLSGATTGPWSVVVTNPGGANGTLANGFTVNPPAAPFITSINPTGTTAGGADFPLFLTGQNFTSQSEVQWNGAKRTTTYISTTNISAAILATDIASSGAALVAIFNPGGGGLSNIVGFTINSTTAPVITSLTPTGVNAGMGPFTLVVTGSNFLSNSVVRWNGVNRTTTYISASNLTVPITAIDVSTPGTAIVTVFNPSGGGLSNEKNFSINPTGSPVISSLNPTSATAGGTLFTLIVTGSNFIPNSTVRWNGADRTTSYTSSTNLTATINAADISVAGTGLITVFNPGLGWVSNTVSFPVTAQNPSPSITGISPTSKYCGDTSFILTVTGTNFITGSKVRWNGVEKTTTYGSATTLTAQITAADIEAAGTPAVTVVNPTPGGGTSNVVSFTVNSNPAPSLSAITPTHIMAGTDGFTLTVSGTNFNERTTIRWGGVDRETTYISATSLSTEIYAEYLTEDVTVAVTVFNPPCGGGTSNAITFTIDAVPEPILTAIAPDTITAGSDGFILEVTGSDFVEGSSVRWNGVDLDTVYISSSSLEADVPADNIGSPGAADITVFNPPPGGGTSDALTLTISAPPTSIITRVSPNRVYTGGSSFTLTVYGSDFLDGSIVQWNGIDQHTSFVSGNKLLAAISATELVSQGKAKITVFTPFGGGTSNIVFVTIARAVNPVPVIKDTWPGAWKAGANGFVLTVTGSGFVPKSRVRWNGMNMYTTYLSSERLAARIPAKAVIGAGTVRITVYNPPLGGGTSNNWFFPVQVINNIDPEPRHL
jgi:hypothetical protein